MSEENEHTTEETEAEMSTENHGKEQSKTETSMLNNETEQPMLEDEEMPTYISVSSPSRREDSDAHDTKQQDRIPIEEEHSRSPYPSDDQGADSIYVLSSGDESNHPFNYEEDEEYGDSEEDEEEEEDEDDDDEENALRLPTNYDEDVDPEYEQECFDRASDDFILNNRLKQYHKERSLSLQDLSSLKSNINTAFNRKRHSLNIFRHNYLGMQPPSVVYPIASKKQMVPVKYQHVESKVKQYIKDIKEQNRRSIEKRIKEQEFMTTTNNEESEDNDAQQLKARVTNRMIKDYAEKALKDIEQDENGGGNLVYNVAHIIANGENNKTSNKVVEKEYRQIRKGTDVQIATSTQNCDDKLEKRNGSIDVNARHIELQNTLNKNKQFSNVNQSSLVNGHQQSPTINLNAVNYAQYVHGPPNSEQTEELIEQGQDNTNETQIYTDVEMINAQDIGNSNADCPLKIENVKSISVAQDESAALTYTKINSADRVNAESAELIRLKAQLNQKDAQFLNLRDAYQKTLAENIKMKQELEALKKSLTKYESEKKTCETKIASVQTEKEAAPTANQDTTASEKTNKMSTSSVASTISSIDQWADSACSPAISIKAPDLTPILNSDDSIVLSNGVTPRKIAHPLSRTFITSSRILQTLSNITQGKTRVESPLLKDTMHNLNEKSGNHLPNLNCNSPIHASNSKKRKATDMLSSSTFIQPSKIPHVTVESEEKSSNDSTDEFRYSQAHSNSKAEKQDNTSANEKINASTSTETKIDETNDHNDCVKCFIYRDHEDSRSRSFLIQAEEPTKEIVENEKNRIQECGPYLLGNLEVRMSEINGTISVWGKEVNHESTSENEDVVETSGRSADKKLCQTWQNASRSRFNGSPLGCSSDNNHKVPLRLNKSSTSQCCQSVSLNSIKTPSFVDDVNCKRHLSTSHSSNTSVRSFGNCESSKYHKDCTACKGASTSRENLHSCCTHHTEIIDNECNCRSCRERQKYDVISKCCKNKFNSKGTQRHLCRSTPESWNHLQENTNADADADVNDVLCKYHTTCRRFLSNIMNTCGPHSKNCNIGRDVPCTCQSCTENTNHHDSSEKHTCKNLSNDCDVEPLLSFKRSNETLTTRQRRLSGKRVRGILMDLLRGCGDCRSNNASRLSNSETEQGEPQAKSSPAYTLEAACSSSTQCKDRCCHAYALRIESQLEEFRSEMERVRSRSDAILEMLNVLHSVDVN